MPLLSKKYHIAILLSVLTICSLANALVFNGNQMSGREIGSPIDGYWTTHRPLCTEDEYIFVDKGEIYAAGYDEKYKLVNYSKINKIDFENKNTITMYVKQYQSGNDQVRVLRDAGDILYYQKFTQYQNGKSVDYTRHFKDEVFLQRCNIVGKLGWLNVLIGLDSFKQPDPDELENLGKRK